MSRLNGVNGKFSPITMKIGRCRGEGRQVSTLPQKDYAVNRVQLRLSATGGPLPVRHSEQM